jgi:type III pantothenate kinase
VKHPEETWLALSIGNSRLHWAKFHGWKIQETWDTPHIPSSAVETAATQTKSACADCADINKQGVIRSDLLLPTSSPSFPHSLPHSLTLSLSPSPPLYLASVVPEQTAIWQAYPNVQVITLERVPLSGTYPTFGIDRALAVWGAGQTYGFPILVIDGGTALTFTGADARGRLIGGAILSGLRSQLRFLATNTAALPEVELPTQMPSRWALNTKDAIQSGTIYTLIAGIKDFVTAWNREFPDSKVVITGGDRSDLLNYLQAYSHEIAAEIVADPHLIFWGMRSLVI